MSWFERCVTSWSDLNDAIEKDLVLKASPAGIGYLFRGHADRSWNLIPRLSRIVTAAGLTAERALQVEHDLRELFTARAHEYLHPSITVKTKSSLLDWWTLMQHYSAPTRLLDWTLSPFVGVYFALIEKLKKDGVVWYVHAATLDSYMRVRSSNYATQRFGSLAKENEIAEFHKLMLSEDAPEDHFYVMRRPIETDRMASQQAMFTICPSILGHHGKIISATLGEKKAAFAGKWIIPSEKKLELLAKLRTANITASSLFPGLDGVGRAALELARMEAVHWASVNGAVANSPGPDSKPEPTD